MPKRKCSFNDNLQRKFPMMQKGKHYWEVYCTICLTNISIANKGVNDINEHLNTQKHKTNLRSQANTSDVATFMIKPGPDEDVIRAAEGTMAYHTVCHHMSFNSLDCTTALNRELFSGSDIAKKLRCNRTKATAIVNNVLNPLSIAELSNDLQDVAFISVSTDASNHGSTKLFPIIIQYFKYQNNGITSKLLEIETTENETSDTITELIVKQLRRHNLLTKCIAFSGDNCNTNFGGRERTGTNNVFHKLKAVLNSNIVGVGCSVHIINNAVHHGCDLLPLDVESIILKIYNYFAIYTVRTESLKEFCAAADTKYEQLLYHSKTRWLSLFPAIERFLKLYQPIKDYFESLEKPPVLIKQFFQNDLSEAYLFIVHSIMHILHTRIEKLEKSDNSIIETRNILASITKNLDDRLKENFLPLKVQSILKKQSNDIKNEFNNKCMTFYKEIKTYIENWIKPLNEFENFDWMFLSNITEDTKWTAVQNTVLFLQNRNIKIDDIKLLDEWMNLKTFSQNLSEQDKHLTVNKLWHTFFKTPNAHTYTELLKIAQYFFCIPAHNANVERVFSLIIQQWTKERNSLGSHTVSSMIKIKYNFKDMSCVDFYKFLLGKKNILKAIGKVEKYKTENEND